MTAGPAARPTANVAVVGAGWAGLAAAVALTQAGRRVTVFEMAPQPGGRARSVPVDEPEDGRSGDPAFDNGQHILIGAYLDTLALMRTVGANPDRLLHRMPLSLVDAAGTGLRLPPGAAVPAFVRGVLGHPRWSLGERLALLAAAAGWGLRRFECSPSLTVDALCAGLPRRLRDDLVDPLCVAALNTPAEVASAQVFLRVLRDALFSGPGAADLLLPRVPLGDLLPAPALQWLAAHGAVLRHGRRVTGLQADGQAWVVDGERFDAVVLAAGPAQSARLASDVAPAWAARTAALPFEPIATVYLHSPGSTLAAPMVALASDDHRAPAQFAFDHGALGGCPGRFAFVVSGAAPWVARGRELVAEAALAQARTAFPPGTWVSSPVVSQVIVEKRATFRCLPGLARPSAWIAPGLVAAGDHLAGPYPSTLEGAVRSGGAAAALLGRPQVHNGRAAMQKRNASDRMP